MDFTDFSQYMLFISVFLWLINIFLCVYHLFARKDALLKNEGSRFAFSVGVLVVLVLLCALSVWAYPRMPYVQWFGIPMVVLSVIFLFLFGWFFAHLRGVEDRAMEVLEALVGVIEAGDPNLDGHSLHVKNLTMLLYDHLPARYTLHLQRNNLRYAALLLDVGKLGIPRSIIAKTGKLQEDEWNLVRRHPELAVKIFAPIQSFDCITTWIKYHHERVDGTGYYHLTGDQIPLASRIIAIADSYSAMTMERSYKASLTHQEALSELRQAAGKQLDGDLVRIFCDIPFAKIEESSKDVLQKMQRYQEGDFR